MTDRGRPDKHLRVSSPQISFCTALKDRSKVDLGDGIHLTLFPNCVASLAAACAEAGVVAEVVVADFASSDAGEAKAALERSGLDYQWHSLDGGFCRGMGLNRAASEARAGQLFFLDADMLVSAALVRRIVDLVGQGVAFFPWCLSYRDPQHTSTWGMCGVSADDFWAAGQVIERGEWGHEDLYFREALSAHGCKIVREQGEGLFHQWHPNDHAWKNRFSRKAVESGAGGSGNCLFELHGEHARWRDKVRFLADGRFSRGNGDPGTFELAPGGALTLNWDRWGSETLNWDAESGGFVTDDRRLILRVPGR